MSAAARTTTDADLAFLVVGMERSGTTLVQRLACELPGVGMPPETHFVAAAVPALLARPGEREAVLRAWLAGPQARGLEFDAEAWLARTRDASPGDVFARLVRALTPTAAVRGEKTPAHGAWWRPLARWSAGLRFVVVVRDPRAVVLSNLAAPWGEDFAAASWGGHREVAGAERWRQRHTSLLALVRTLPDRALLLRYEDVVADPDAARARIAALLGLAPATATPPAPTPPAATPPAAPAIVQPWEHWKQAALGPVTVGRVQAWRTEMDPDRARAVAAVCRAPMAELGYPEVPGRVSAAGRIARLPPHTLRALRGLRRGLEARERWVGRVVL